MKPKSNGAIAKDKADTMMNLLDSTDSDADVEWLNLPPIKGKKPKKYVFSFFLFPAVQRENWDIVISCIRPLLEQCSNFFFFVHLLHAFYPLKFNKLGIPYLP